MVGTHARKYHIYSTLSIHFTKNKLSFALAILDTNNNGIIINSIYGADNSNVYAKSVENGISKYQLSSEEQEALNKAMKIKNK